MKNTHLDASPLFNNSDRPTENDPRHFVSMMTSASHTYGCALAYATKWVIDHFPKNTFKTVHTSTKIAHAQLRKIDHEVLKKKRPMIVFRPRIAEPDEDRFLKGTLLIDRQTDMFGTWGIGALQPFIRDNRHNLVVSYQLNRAVINMDVALIFDTYMQQQDYVAYIQNAFKLNHPEMKSIILESYIPEEMIFMMGEISGIPVYDDDMCTKAFFDYFNTKTINSVLSYKLQDSSGRKEFFRAYPCNMELMVSNVNYDDGNKVNQVSGNYQITFSVRLEFNTTGLYYMFADRELENWIEQMRRDHIRLFGKDYTEKDRITPQFVDILDAEDLNLPPGWEIYTQCQFTLEQINDTLDITSLLNRSLNAAIDYHAKNGLPLYEFYDVRIRRNGDLLRANVDYEYIYNRTTKKHTLYMYNRDVAHSYSIIILINATYINDLIRNAYDIK